MEPCYPCPANTYRNLEGGTELGSCTACPAKSTTRNSTGNTDVSYCKCDIFYYLQSVSTTLGTTPICADCPVGCVCNSDRSCALGNLPTDRIQVGDIESSLKCSNPADVIVGTWKRLPSGEFSLIQCPAGYTLQASNHTVTLDTCVICPAGSYLLGTVDSQSITCKPCPIGADCPGGSVVNSLPGFWQPPTTRRNVDASVQIYQCPVGVCGSNNTCLNNRIGLVRNCCLFF